MGFKVAEKGREPRRAFTARLGIFEVVDGVEETCRAKRNPDELLKLIWGCLRNWKGCENPDELVKLVWVFEVFEKM